MERRGEAGEKDWDCEEGPEPHAAGYQSQRAFQGAG
jgi:hypothetical protein